MAKQTIYLPYFFSLALLTAAPLFPYNDPFDSAVLNETTPFEVIADEASLPILTPAMEGRVVEKLILKNGLKVYLISDPGAEQSAAGVTVAAGSWADPKEYPGMAHFCEHMLFMGTQAYPNEFEYMQFIADHGGKVNAFTAADRTCYMFSINNDSFEEALDRFSHFFIDPLFSLHCINRELHAVDQEHAKNIEHDGWRQYMILKETGNPEHPNAGFSTGNANTLSGIPSEALKNWYRSHYSADQMHLAIISPLPIEELRALALEDFSLVPQFPVNETLLPQTMSSSSQRGHMIFIKPVKDIKQLSLSWEVPKAFAQDLETKAPQLVAFALNQEGENSLIQALKKEKIAENLVASCDRFDKDSLFFSIDISLTDYGVEHINTAILNVFEALARLKKEGFPAHLFREVKTMATLNYQYQSREDAYETITNTASEILYEDLSTYPLKTRIPFEFHPERIHDFVSTLSAEDCIYFVLADPSKTKVLPNRKEKWMNAEYTICSIEPTQLTAWNKADLIPAIQLPLNNPYLPSSLALIPLPEQNETKPTLIASDNTAKIFYAPDSRYHVPEISFVFTFKSPLLDHTASSHVLADLYVRSLSEKLSSTLSMAASAGLSSRIFSADYKIGLRLNGYSDKAPLLLSEIFSGLKNVLPSKEEFEIYRLSLASDYDNQSKELPLKQAMEELDSLLFNTPTNHEKYQAIQLTTYEDFITFSKMLFECCFTEGMLYGNIDNQAATRLWTQLKNQLNAQPFPKSKQYRKKVLVLSDKYGPYKLEETTQRQGTGALLLLQEGPFTFERRAVQQILGSALSDAFFDTLRTKQQTGYIAKAWNTEEERQLFQFFAVQSSTHTPTELLARFELFLETFDKNLSMQIPEGRFESIRASLITLLKMPPENMPLMASQLNELAFEYDDFDWFDKRIKSLEALTYRQFYKMVHPLLSRDNPRRLAVLMEGVIAPENDFHYELMTKSELHDIGTFVSVNE